MIGQWAARDEIRLEANVSVVTGIHHTGDSRQCGGTHMSSITRFQHNMNQMLEFGRKADITFIVSAGARGSLEPTVYQAHALILTERSSYFSAMLNGTMIEATCGKIYIDHCRPSVFKQLLKFLYTGACDLSGIGNERPNENSSKIKVTPITAIHGLDDDLNEGKEEKKHDETTTTKTTTTLTTAGQQLDQ